MTVPGTTFRNTLIRCGLLCPKNILFGPTQRWVAVGSTSSSGRESGLLPVVTLAGEKTDKQVFRERCDSASTERDSPPEFPLHEG
jgi:hypothetical protein